MAGRGSYSTFTRERALSTVCRSSAAMANTGSPINRTTLSRKNICFFFFSVRRENQYSITLGTSRIVATALTPGSFSAEDVSIRFTLAWACGLRISFACSIFSSLMSVAYLADPVTFSTPSIRSRDFPTAI